MGQMPIRSALVFLLVRTVQSKWLNFRLQGPGVAMAANIALRLTDLRMVQRSKLAKGPTPGRRGGVEATSSSW